MTKLGKSLVEELIDSSSTSSKEKEKIGDRIVELLSGDPTKRVTNLPPRRGNGDGGIDGRVRVIATSTEKIIAASGVYYRVGLRAEQEAAINVKIEDKKFSPEAFGYFKDAMERENIFIGIIITARGLSPDVKMRISSINSEKVYCFYHIFLEDIIQGRVNEAAIEFQCGSISKRFSDELDKYIDSSCT